MHILILPSEEFLPEHSPTSGIFQYQQASILAKAGNKVGIISISQSFTIYLLVKHILLGLIGKKGEGNYNNSIFTLGRILLYKLFYPKKYLRNEIKDEISVYRINGFYYTEPTESNMAFSWVKAGLTAFKQYIKDNGAPDIIHAHNAVYAGILADRIKEKYGVKYIITEHSSDMFNDRIHDKKLQQHILAAYSHADGLNAVSEKFVEHLNNRFNGLNFDVLHNVLDPYLLSKATLKEQKAIDAFQFIIIAQLKPIKNHIALIDAFEILAAQHTNATLQIGGDGELEETLKSYVQSKKSVKDKIHFLGYLNRDAVIDSLSKADCLVLTSHSETFGVVVIEAMLFGKPVVVTKCGGPENIVHDEVGAVCENTPSDIAAAMHRIIANYNNYKPAGIRKYAIGNFGDKAFLNNVNTLYNKALRNAA